MRNVVYRFRVPTGTELARSEELIRSETTRSTNDYLRSRGAAIKKLNHLVEKFGKNSHWWQFDQCGNEKGYNDGIGFQCGRYKESASCPLCQYTQRQQMALMPIKKTMFKEPCWQITVYDNRREISVDDLYSYKPEEFKAILEQFARKAKKRGRTFKSIGHIEYCARPSKSKNDQSLLWHPHIHIVASGTGVKKFGKLCKKFFKSNIRHSKPVLIKRIDNATMNRAFQYQFKGYFSKSKDKMHQTDNLEFELSEHLLDRTCSDLLWCNGVYIPGRIELSSERDLDLWHKVNGYTFLFLKDYRKRIVPKISAKSKMGLFNKRGEIKPNEFYQRLSAITEELKRQELK